MKITDWLDRIRKISARAERVANKLERRPGDPALLAELRLLQAGGERAKAQFEADFANLQRALQFLEPIKKNQTQMGKYAYFDDKQKICSLSKS